jgi:RND family efflux transporter MFP subunit
MITMNLATRSSFPVRLAVAAGLAFLFTACQKEAAAPAATPLRQVAVESVALTTDQPPIEAAGVLVRKLEPTLAFKVGGIVAEVAVRAGETVRRGQVLARLEPAEIDAQAAQAQSALLKARRDAERLSRLQSERVATLEQLQNARTGVEVAEAQLRVVDFNRRFATIVAPADGRVLRRHTEPGELVAPGQPVITFGTDADGWVFRASVSERDVRRLARGDAAALNFRGPPPATLAAVVAQVAEAADPQTRTFELELTVPENPAGLRSGAVGTLTIVKPGAVARPRVPLAALLEGHGRTAFLFELNSDGRTVRRRPVEIELLLGDSAFLATPLAAGTRIVTAGAEYLRDGEAVVVAAPR